MSFEEQEPKEAAKSEKKSFRTSVVGKPLTRNAGLLKVRGIGESKVPDGWSWRIHEIPSDCGKKSQSKE